jgi:aryl sulfotransferase
MSVNVERLRDYRGTVTNTDIWSEFTLRPDDIIVNTPPKCGTTWMLNIVMMLIHGRVIPDAGGSQNAPWLDCEFRDRQAIAAFLDGLDRRRCIKTHTPMDGILFGEKPTYITVYRHPIDVHFSFRTHVANMKADWLDYMFPEDEREGFKRFVEASATDSGTDDLTVASLVQHYHKAKARAPRGNVHFFHYADLTRDLPGQITRLAAIMDAPLSTTLRDEIAEATTFKTMRKAVEQSEHRFHKESSFHDRADFFASGTSNKWEGRLTDEDMNDYKNRIIQLLPPEDIAWLEWGERRSP